MRHFAVTHKYQKFPAQEASVSSGMASASQSSLATHSSSVSLPASSSAASLSIDYSEKSFVPRQKLLMMTVDDKTVSTNS